MLVDQILCHVLATLEEMPHTLNMQRMLPNMSSDHISKQKSLILLTLLWDFYVDSCAIRSGTKKGVGLLKNASGYIFL